MNNNYLDIEGGLGRLRGNKKLYGRMLQMFMQSAEIDALETALDGQDYPKAAELAHTIKGVSGNLSMPELFETSTELMNQLRSGAPTSEALARYREAVAATRPLVEATIADLAAEA